MLFDYFTTLDLAFMGIFKDVLWIHVKFNTFGQFIRLNKRFLTFLKVPFETALYRCATLTQRNRLSITNATKFIFILLLIQVGSTALDRNSLAGVVPLCGFLIL